MILLSKEDVAIWRKVSPDYPKPNWMLETIAMQGDRRDYDVFYVLRLLKPHA